MRRISKLFLILVVMIMIIGCFSTESSAGFLDRFLNRTEESGGSGFDWKDETGKMLNSTASSEMASSVQGFAGTIIFIIRIIATGVAIIMLIVLAMKYMMAAPGDRADIKKHAVVYVVGAVVLFSVTGILQIIQEWASTNIKI